MKPAPRRRLDGGSLTRPDTPRAAALALAALSLAAGLALLAPAARAEEAAGVLDATRLEPRGPIAILGDAAFTPANGVRRGTGVEGDPFVVADWLVQGTGAHGVLVANTTLAFVVENVRVAADAGGVFRDGFRLENVTGGMLDHVEAIGQHRFGVYLEFAEGTRVCDAIVASNGWIGLYSHRSNRQTWDGVVAHHNVRHGIYLANGSSFNRVTRATSYAQYGNGAYSFGFYSGIGADYNVVDNGTFTDNARGIQVNLVRGNVFRDNVATGNRDAGIAVLESEDTLAESNLLTDNGRGVWSYRSRGIDVVRNTIEGNAGPGVEISDHPGTTVRHNVVRNNAVGVQVVNGSSGNLVYDNVFSNPRNARDLVGGSAWNVSKRAGPNVVGGAWIGGNYWSDASEELHDHDEDGLAESHGPYADGIVSGGDYLPLVTDSGGPHARFSASAERVLTREPVDLRDESRETTYPIVNWTWTLGDGATAYGRNVTHAWASPGDYRVHLRVRDSYGLVSATSRVVTVLNRAPEPRLAGGTDLATTRAVDLDASPSTDADGRVVAWAWAFGDGATAAGARAAHAYTRDGHYAAVLTVTDDAGASASLGLSVLVDATPPETIAAASGPAGARGWFAGPAAVTLAAFDAGIGVAATDWRAADGAWTAYDGPLALGDGAHDVRYRSRDRLGNVEVERVVTVRVDATPPETSYRGPRALGAGATLRLSATDATSGVARTFYRLPGGGWTLYEDGVKLDGVPEGEVTVRAWSEDVAGNAESETSFTVLVDRTAPSIDARSPGATSATARGVHAAAPSALAETLPEAALVVGHVVVNATATDALAGVARIRILVDGEIVAESAGPSLAATWRSTDATPTPHTLRVEAWDAAGNASALERRFTALASPA